jgi:hypothetical protein
MPLLDPILNFPLVSRIRRNHGLEHASLHILAKQNPGKPMGGYSDFNGFWLIGDLTVDQVRAGVREALARMKNGEHNLAVHPNCGTNFATAGSLAGLAAVMGMIGVGSRKRDKLERLPLVATLATLALILAQPLGLSVQKNITTCGIPGDLEVIEIYPTQRGRVKAHRILTQG